MAMSKAVCYDCIPIKLLIHLFLGKEIVIQLRNKFSLLPSPHNPQITHQSFPVPKATLGFGRVLSSKGNPAKVALQMELQAGAASLEVCVQLSVGRHLIY